MRGLRLAWALWSPGWVLPGAITLVVLVAGALTWIHLPRGSAVVVRGEVVSFTPVFSSKWTHGVATVLVEGERVRVALPTQSACEPGDTLVLTRQRRMLAKDRYEALGPCRSGPTP